jgi:fluoride exporter
MAMTSYGWIALGGALGSVARVWCGEMVLRWWGAAFPWGTFGVNVIGSLVIGFLAGAIGPGPTNARAVWVQQFWMVGVCGGFTTFSAFSLQTVTLCQRGEWTKAAVYACASVGVCVAATVAGQFLGLSLSAGRRG